MKRTRKRTPKNILKRKPAVTRPVGTTTYLPEYHCRHCGYDWSPRTNVPAECPRCKSRNWLKSMPLRKDDIHRKR